jgi:putative phosphoesterase
LPDKNLCFSETDHICGLTSENQAPAAANQRPDQLTENPMASQQIRIGIISDTHGQLKDKVLDLFADADLILHAGDIGSKEILEKLRRLSPLTAVRGNMDHGQWADSLPAIELVEAGSIRVCLLHDLQHLDLDPPTAGIHVVVSGHTHQPSVCRRNGVLFLNPGSASLPRRRLSASIALLAVRGIELSPRIIELE